jgi:hypothetical protein
MASSLRQLPANYTAHSTLDFGRKGLIRTLLNLTTFVVWLVCSGLLLLILARFRPDVEKFAPLFGQVEGVIGAIALAVFLFGGAIVLHEGAHRVCYWLFTGERPCISPPREGVYYVAPPDCYVPKRLFLIVTLTPLLVWSVASLIAVAFISTPTVYWVAVLLALNIAICVGDLVMISWALIQPRNALFNDRGPVTIAYAPTL